MHALKFLWLEIFSLLSQKSFGPWLWTSRITFLSSSIDKGLLKLNIWCVTWKNGKPAEYMTSVVSLSFCRDSSHQHCLWRVYVSVCQDGVWCISSLLGSNQTRGLKAFPLLACCSGEETWSSIKSPNPPPVARAAISTGSRVIEQVPNADLGEITSCSRFSRESERRAQVVREPSVKLGQQTF